MKEITIEEYNLKMQAIIAKKLSVEKTLMLMLKEAGKYKIKDNNK